MLVCMHVHTLNHKYNLNVHNDVTWDIVHMYLEDLNCDAVSADTILALRK